MRSRLLPGAASISILVLAPVAFAQDAGPSDATPDVVLGEVVVTATRIEQPIDRVPGSVTVIDRDEIDRNGYRTLGDAIRAVPGLSLTRYGGIGGLTNVQARGTPASNVLVLLDGIPINDTAGVGEFDFGVDLLGDVERIEVVRGPGATLHGNNAAGGVINLVTRSGADQPGRVYGSVAIGNRERLEGLAGVSGRQGGFDYDLSVQGLTTDGRNVTPDRLSPNVSEEDGFENRTFTASAGYDMTNAVRVDGLLRVRRSKSHIDDGGADDPNHVNTSDQTVWRLGGEIRNFGASLISRLDVGQVTYDRTDVDRADPTDPTVTNDRFDSRRSYADFQNTIEAGSVGAVEDTMLVAGIELNRDSIDVSNSGATERTEDAVGYYAVAQGTVLDRLALTLAGRLSDSEGFDSEATYRAGAIWTFDEIGTKLHGALGTAYREPSLTERFGPFGNADLEPETSFSWEIGVEQALDLDGRERFLVAGITYFRTEIDDKIDFDIATFTTRNINRAEIDGVETFATLRPTDWLEAKLSWTWTDALDVQNDRPLSGVPKHKVALSATASPTGAWTITPEVIYISEQFGFIYAVSGGIGANGFNDGYTLVNLATTYDLNDTHQLFGRIENMLDRDYEVPNGYLGQGLTALAGIRASF